MNEKVNSISKELANSINEANLSTDEKVAVLLDLFSVIIDEDIAFKLLSGKPSMLLKSDCMVIKEKIRGVPLSILCGVLSEEE